MLEGHYVAYADIKREFMLDFFVKAVDLLPILSTEIVPKTHSFLTFFIKDLLKVLLRYDTRRKTNLKLDKIDNNRCFLLCFGHNKDKDCFEKL